MQSGSRHILFIGAALGSISILYFLSLAFSIPFILTVVINITALFALYRWMDKLQTITFSKRPLIGLFLLAIGIFLIANRSYYLAENNGQWDAWAMWNFHARFLAIPGEWKKIFADTQFGHPDYPLLLPSTVAFFSRLGGNPLSTLVPFALSFLITLCIPVLIYLETYSKNIFIAACVLLLFATDDYYLKRGVSQYADIFVAFFFLCALVCINHYKDDRRYVTMSAIFLGCCIWTKNEGVILAFLFLLFYANVFFSRSYIKCFAAGLVIPLVTLIFFKTAYAPKNDILEHEGNNVLQLVSDKLRYKAIYESFKANMRLNFPHVKTGAYLYILLCAYERNWPGKQMLLIVCCLCAYMFIYVVSPYGLDWHLATSQDRLMLQLMPATMYIITKQLSEVKFSTEQ